MSGTDNPLVHPGIDGIRETDEYNRVSDKMIDTEMDRLIELEDEYGAHLYAALEKIAAEKTGKEPAPIDVNDEALEDARAFAEDLGVETEAGGHALYSLISDATTIPDSYEESKLLRKIAVYYSPNRSFPGVHSQTGP